MVHDPLFSHVATCLSMNFIMSQCSTLHCLSCLLLTPFSISLSIHIRACNINTRWLMIGMFDILTMLLSCWISLWQKAHRLYSSHSTHLYLTCYGLNIVFIIIQPVSNDRIHSTSIATDNKRTDNFDHGMFWMSSLVMAASTQVHNVSTFSTFISVQYC